jgi:hypothetical protein
MFFSFLLSCAGTQEQAQKALRHLRKMIVGDGQHPGYAPLLLKGSKARRTPEFWLRADKDMVPTLKTLACPREPKLGVVWSQRNELKRSFHTYPRSRL